MIVIGWIVMGLVALLSKWISGLIVINGAHPFEAILVGIILGAVARNTGIFPKKWEPYLKKFETPLLWGIVLLGAGFSVKIASELPISLVVIFSTMLVGFFFIYFLGKKPFLRLSHGFFLDILVWLSVLSKVFLAWKASVFLRQPVSS